MRRLALLAVLFFACSTPCWAQFVLGAGYNYLNADTPPTRSSLNGWYVMPQYNFTPRFGAFFISTNFYGSTPLGSTNIHGYTAGPILMFPNHTRFTPGIFTEFGDVRVSTPHSITNSFGWVIGASVTVKMAKGFSLVLIPPEYTLTTPPQGTRHNFIVQAGIAYTFGKR